MMDIENTKRELIDWISGLKDDSVIEKIKLLKEGKTQSDWWNEITDEEKASIEKGVEDEKAGRIIPHSEVKKEYGKWL